MGQRAMCQILRGGAGETTRATSTEISSRTCTNRLPKPSARRNAPSISSGTVTASWPTFVSWKPCAFAAARGLITARIRGYEPADVVGAWLVFACTDRREINAAVAADAERRIWCVRADDGAASAAWVPAVGRLSDTVVAVNAGRNPRLAAVLRDRCMDTVGAAARSDGDGRARRRVGLVSIVGGGPGDPGLITVAGWRRRTRTPW